MKYKISELDVWRLNAAVAKIEGLPTHPGPGSIVVADDLDTVYAHERAFTTQWAHGGPIIERERIMLSSFANGDWEALAVGPAGFIERVEKGKMRAKTPLVAAMRAFCAARFGDEVELP